MEPLNSMEDSILSYISCLGCASTITLEFNKDEDDMFARVECPHCHSNSSYHKLDICSSEADLAILNYLKYREECRRSNLLENKISMLSQRINEYKRGISGLTTERKIDLINGKGDPVLNRIEFLSRNCRDE